MRKRKRAHAWCMPAIKVAFLPTFLLHKAQRKPVGKNKRRATSRNLVRLHPTKWSEKVDFLTEFPFSSSHRKKKKNYSLFFFFICFNFS